MADEDEVDVEGDFDMDIGLDQEALPNLYIDMNEPPSKSANLLPEYTQHPWMLEQGWSLDHCTDEKSKAAIEKMLQEEQQYINGRVSTTKVTSAAQSSTTLQKQAHQKRTWTEEERQLFQKGLEIYGRSWSRIAELVPDKTTQQVKSFGQHYFKIKAREDKYKKESKPIVKTQLPIGIQNAIRAVTTAQPTVKVSPKKLCTYYDSTSLVWNDPHTQNFDQGSEPSLDKQKKEARSCSKSASPIRSKKGKLGRPPKDKISPKGTQNKTNLRETLTNDNVSQKLNSLIVSSEVVRIPSSRADDSDDSDVDIDVDVEDDVPTESHVEDVVYRKLVESAGIASLMNGQGPEQPEETSPASCDQQQAEDNVEQADMSMGTEKVHVGGHKLSDTANEKLEEYERSTVSKLESGGRSMESVTEAEVKSVLYEVLPETPPEILLNESSESEPKLEELAHKDGESRSTDQVFESHVILELDDLSGVTNTKHNSTAKVSNEGASIVDDDNSSSSEEAEEDPHPNEFGILTSAGYIVYLPNPMEEVVLPRDMTSEEEQRIHSEFFSQRPGAKTPDRYLRIRNFILDAWERCRPQYLNKTSVRPGLKNCGDVNSIGRIHAYLEQIGAINFNCSQVQYLKSNRAVPIKPKLVKEQDHLVTRNDMPSRKRRVRDVEGQWVDERELEGKTTEHREKDKLEKRKKVVRLRTAYDPFQLITCRKFWEDQPAPFRLVMESQAVVIIDIHAHMSKTEVIGLLGGYYHREQGHLQVTMALPCESLSTGMQCEMDPVSQTEACETIERAEQSVVGWYHSHPTFVPDPSCRDLETQQKYQDWFGKGGNPFIGVIVSPYCQGRQDYQSITRCLVVKTTTDRPEAIGQPFEFDFTLSHERWDTEQFRRLVAALADKYITYTNRVHLLQYFTSRSSLSCLQKMVESISHSFPESLLGGKEGLQQLVLETITTVYQEDTERGDQDPADDDQMSDTEAGDEGEMESPSRPDDKVTHQWDLHGDTEVNYDLSRDIKPEIDFPLPSTLVD